MDHTEQQKALIQWWQTSSRDLPWRQTRDPWLVMVSELMLQQTQVNRVIPKYQHFIEKYPNPKKCSEAPPSSIIEAWEGLGYNRRAINLHRTSRVIVETHGGKVPKTLNDLLELPGIGPYTARAILCFAFEEDIGVVDVNIHRIISRVIGRALSPLEIQIKADNFVPDGEGWIWNQALMDLGSDVCGSRSPDCGRCPLKSHCLWKGEGPDPAKRKPSSSSLNQTFEGSDRQGRGKLVNTLRNRRVILSELEEVMGWNGDPERCRRVAAGLIKDGLVEYDDKAGYRLPS